jgi:hypothetical protein
VSSAQAASALLRSARASATATSLRVWSASRALSIFSGVSWLWTTWVKLPSGFAVTVPSGRRDRISMGGRAGLVALPGRQRAAGDLAERGAELRLQVSGGRDGEVVGAAHPAGRDGAEDVLGIGVEVGVDERGHVGAGQGQRPGLLPGFRVGARALAVGEAPADDDVGDHGRAGHPLVRG